MTLRIGDITALSVNSMLVDDAYRAAGLPPS